MTDQVREAGRGHAQARYNRQIAAMPLTWSCAATQGLPGTPTRAGKANYPNNTSDATSTMFNLHVPSRASIDRGTALHAPNEISQAEDCGMQIDLALKATYHLDGRHTPSNKDMSGYQSESHGHQGRPRRQIKFGKQALDTRRPDTTGRLLRCQLSSRAKFAPGIRQGHEKGHVGQTPMNRGCTRRHPKTGLQ